jgi:hypothetical protein
MYMENVIENSLQLVRNMDRFLGVIGKDARLK